MSIRHLEQLIVDRLIEAQVVMRHLSVRNVRPGLPSTFWPETETSILDRWEVVKEQLIEGIRTEDPLRPKRSRPSAAAVSRMEETWEWMKWIDQDKHRQTLAVILFCYAYGKKPTEVFRDLGWSKSTAYHRFNAAVEKIMIRVCKENNFPDNADELLVGPYRPKQGNKNRMVSSNAA